MFGLIKRFFWKPAEPEQSAIPTPPPQPVASAVPAPAAPAPPAAPASPPAGVAIAADLEGVITLPLAPIVASLPANLAALAAGPGSGTFSLPVKAALAQLATGAVRVTFGELRQGSPPGAFCDNATQDKSLVSLPLAQILALMDPELLARRPARKSAAVPESVTSVFGQGRVLQAPIADAPQPVRPPAPVSVPKPDGPTPGASPFTRLPVTAPLPAMPATAPPVAEKEVVAVALSAIWETWPAPVLQAIAEFQLQSATVRLPIGRLEAGLKKGRVVFTWGELCQWLQPAPPENSSARREVALELPLNVVAPLFLARRRPRAVPVRLTGAADIPDQIPVLFSRAAIASETAASVPAAAAPAGALGEIFGLPGRMEWTPAEICRRICALEGVAGSVLALDDGLAVAAQLPAGLKEETVAAFLPQIFGRVSQSAGEMQLGPVSSVALAAGQGRCAIYKAGRLYLAVLSHPGAALPEAMLGRIAAEIAKRNP